MHQSIVEAASYGSLSGIRVARPGRHVSAPRRDQEQWASVQAAQRELKRRFDDCRTDRERLVLTVEVAGQLISVGRRGPTRTSTSTAWSRAGSNSSGCVRKRNVARARRVRSASARLDLAAGAKLAVSSALPQLQQEAKELVAIFSRAVGTARLNAQRR